MDLASNSSQMAEQELKRETADMEVQRRPKRLEARMKTLKKKGTAGQDEGFLKME